MHSLVLREWLWSKKENTFSEKVTCSLNIVVILVNEYHRAESITGLHRSLQLIWIQIQLGRWVKQNHCRVTAYRQIVPDKGAHEAVWVGLRSSQPSAQKAVGLRIGLISLEGEGPFLLGGHRSCKFHLINAKKKKKICHERDFSKRFPQTHMLFFLASVISQNYFILNIFYS